jgi:hypothetical protein
MTSRRCMTALAFNREIHARVSRECGYFRSRKGLRKDLDEARALSGERLPR